MRCKFSLVILLLMATGFTSADNCNLFAQAQPDSVIFTTTNSTSMAGGSGFTRIMLHSNKYLAGLTLPLSIDDHRLIIDSVSIANSIARSSQGWIIQFSETNRRARITIIPTYAGFDLYEFPSRDGELFRVYWTVRPEATAGVARVDSCFLTFYSELGDSVIIGMNASSVSGLSSDCFFVPGTISFERWNCGRIGGGSISNLSNVVYLINYIFRGGPSPMDVSYGNVNCDQVVSVSDAVYLLKYIFSGGSVPCAACQ